MIKSTVFFVIGLFTAFAIMRVYISFFDSNEATCLIQLENQGRRIETFKRMCGHYPSQEEGMNALSVSANHICAKSIWIHGVPRDPWDNEITYILKDDKFYLLSSHSTCSYIPNAKR